MQEESLLEKAQRLSWRQEEVDVEEYEKFDYRIGINTEEEMTIVHRLHTDPFPEVNLLNTDQEIMYRIHADIFEHEVAESFREEHRLAWERNQEEEQKDYLEDVDAIRVIEGMIYRFQLNEDNTLVEVENGVYRLPAVDRDANHRDDAERTLSDLISRYLVL